MAKAAVVVGKNKKKSIKKKPVAKTPSKFISQALINRKKSKAGKKKRPKTKGLVYVKNLPHGFFEEQLRNYFSQFGAITRVRLGRSPKTLNSRGYAFIEFRYPEVAEIAAQTMNNYIMFHRIVKAKFIPPSEINHDYFRSSIMTIKKDGEKVMTSKSILAKKATIENTNKLMTDEDQQNRIEKVRNKVSKQKAKLEKLGIDFDVDLIAKNMGEEVIAPKEKKSTVTIENINEEDLDDDADETFDPAKFDIDSADEFEDFDYDSDESENDELAENEKKQKAIQNAKSASKKYKEEKIQESKVEKKQPKTQSSKKGKNKKLIEVESKPTENPPKKQKPIKKADVKEGLKKEEPTRKLKEPKKAVEKVPKAEKNVKKIKASKDEPPSQQVIEKIAKNIQENKKPNKNTQKKSDGAAQKKTEKVANGTKAKLSSTKENSKESPKLNKVSKVSKKIKKVSVKK